MPLTFVPVEASLGGRVHARCTAQTARRALVALPRVGGLPSRRSQRACIRVCTSMRASDREIADAGDDTGNARRLCTAQTREPPCIHQYTIAHIHPPEVCAPHRFRQGRMTSASRLTNQPTKLARGTRMGMAASNQFTKAIHIYV